MSLPPPHCVGAGGAREQVGLAPLDPHFVVLLPMQVPGLGRPIRTCLFGGFILLLWHMFDFRSHNPLGTRIGVMTHWQDDHPSVKFHFGGAVLRSPSNGGRQRQVPDLLCMSPTPSADGGAGGSVQPPTATPSRRSPFFNAAATPRVGGAEDDLSLLLCQPGPTCLQSLPAYEALSHHVCEHSRRGHTESAATSIIAGSHPSRNRYVAFRGCVAARCISNGPTRETPVSVAHRLLGQKRCPLPLYAV